MRGSDPMRPMGHCIGIVYRSWAFLQRQVSIRTIARNQLVCSSTGGFRRFTRLGLIGQAKIQKTIRCGSINSLRCIPTTKHIYPSTVPRCWRSSRPTTGSLTGSTAGPGRPSGKDLFVRKKRHGLVGLRTLYWIVVLPYSA